MPSSVKEMMDEIMKAKYNSDMEKLRQEIKDSKIQHEFVEELRKEIRNLHEKLESIEQEIKTQIEEEQTKEPVQVRNVQNITINSHTSTGPESKTMWYNSNFEEDLADDLADDIEEEYEDVEEDELNS